MSQPGSAPLPAPDSSVASVAARARKASRAIAQLSTDARNDVLLAVAAAIEANAGKRTSGIAARRNPTSPRGK
jgi:acyl-CoA reductase-like NAD-dependent aldehyde dehydrogenase